MVPPPLSDDYFIRLEGAAREIIPRYRELSGNASRLASMLIHESRFARRIGLWVHEENTLAEANDMSLAALHKAVRQLESKGILGRKKWVESWWYEIRPHQEWKPKESPKQRWRRYRAEITIFQGNPSPISSYRAFWPEVAGEQNAKHSRPLRREGHDLYVACDGEAVRTILQKESVRRLVTRRLRVKLREISRIHFVLEPLPPTDAV